MMELLLMFVLALLPILWLVLALCGMKMEAWKASFGALVVSAALSMGIWQMTPLNAATAAREARNEAEFSAQMEKVHNLNAEIEKETKALREMLANG